MSIPLNVLKYVCNRRTLSFITELHTSEKYLKLLRSLEQKKNYKPQTHTENINQNQRHIHSL